jgi:hypothetical protein
MPAPGDDGQALQRSLESGEASKWLRLILGEEINRKDSRRQISSHSLKATLLSMAAKSGLRHEDAFFYVVDTALSLKEQSRFSSVAMCHFAPRDAYCGFF